MSSHVKGMTSCRPPEDDLISRREAIEWCLEGLNNMPSAQPDLSGYSDRLWKAAYERGKAEAQADIIHCRDCIHYNAGFECLIEGYGIERDKDWFCGSAERRTDEAD